MKFHRNLKKVRVSSHKYDLPAKLCGCCTCFVSRARFPSELDIFCNKVVLKTTNENVVNIFRTMQNKLSLFSILQEY